MVVGSLGREELKTVRALNKIVESAKRVAKRESGTIDAFIAPVWALGSVGYCEYAFLAKVKGSHWGNTSNVPIEFRSEEEEEKISSVAMLEGKIEHLIAFGPSVMGKDLVLDSKQVKEVKKATKVRKGVDKLITQEGKIIKDNFHVLSEEEHLSGEVDRLIVGPSGLEIIDGKHRGRVYDNTKCQVLGYAVALRDMLYRCSKLSIPITVSIVSTPDSIPVWSQLLDSGGVELVHETLKRIQQLLCRKVEPVYGYFESSYKCYRCDVRDCEYFGG